MHELKPECMRTRLIKNLLILFGLFMLAWGMGLLLANMPFSGDWVLVSSLGVVFVGIGAIIPKTYIEID